MRLGVGMVCGWSSPVSDQREHRCRCGDGQDQTERAESITGSLCSWVCDIVSTAGVLIQSAAQSEDCSREEEPKKREHQSHRELGELGREEHEQCVEREESCDISSEQSIHLVLGRFDAMETLVLGDELFEVCVRDVFAALGASSGGSASEVVGTCWARHIVIPEEL